jgi:hypothetical protein
LFTPIVVTQPGTFSNAAGLSIRNGKSEVPSPAIACWAEQFKGVAEACRESEGNSTSEDAKSAIAVLRARPPKGLEGYVFTAEA